MRDKLFEYARELRKQANKLEALAQALEQEARAIDPSTDGSHTVRLAKLAAPAPKSFGEISLESGEAAANSEDPSLAGLPEGVLLSRSDYETCHISIANLTGRLPAVLIDNRYYSFARSFPDLKKALAAKTKLEWGGDRLVITQTAKGYAIWVWEPDAQAERPLEPDSSGLEGPPHLNSANPPLFNGPQPWDSKSRGRASHLRLLASRSELDPEAEATLAEYLSALNRLSELAHRYLGIRVVLHYWKTSRPEEPWLEKFEILSSGKIIFRGAKDAILNGWEQEQLQYWAAEFIYRCRRIINDFPQRFLLQGASDRLVAILLLACYDTV